MEMLLQRSTVFNEEDSAANIVDQLLNVRTKKELKEVMLKYFKRHKNNQGLLCYLISKNNNKRLIRIDINFPEKEKVCFERMLLNSLSVNKITDDDFKHCFSSSTSQSVSYGLSLFYDRNASFCRMLLPEKQENGNSLVLETLVPYIHAALNNIQYHEDTNNDEIYLSRREKQVISWVSKGKTNKEIGIILQVSQFTIKNHIANIYAKLNVVNRAQAIETVIRLNCLV